MRLLIDHVSRKILTNLEYPLLLFSEKEDHEWLTWEKFTASFLLGQKSLQMVNEEYFAMRIQLLYSIDHYDSSNVEIPLEQVSPISSM